MKRSLRLVAVAGLLTLALWGCGDNQEVGDQKTALAKIEKLGGRIEFGADAQGRRVIRVDFFGAQVTDAGLKYLKGLTQLQQLSLIQAQVTDAGLEHLKGLTQLERLNLTSTQVTDAGLEHLEGLTQLRQLNLTPPRSPAPVWNASRA